DGRRRHRPAGDPRHGRGDRLSRPLRGGDSFRRELVEARPGRGAAHLHRAAPDRGVSTSYLDVMAGLVPAIHALVGVVKTWMPGTRPGMTDAKLLRCFGMPSHVAADLDEVGVAGARLVD